jgi:hypothetical protein
MSLMTRAGLLAGAAALTLTGFAGATTDANTDDLRAQVEKLQNRIAELETRQGDNWLTERRAGEIRSLVHDVLADADTRASLLSSGMTAGYDGGFTVGDTAGNFLLRINGQLQTRWIYSYQRAGEIEVTEDGIFAGLGGDPDAADLDVEAQGLGFADYADFQDAFASASTTGLDGQIEALGEGNELLGWMFEATDGDRHRSGFENSRTKLWFSGHVINPNWQYVVEADFGAGGNFWLRDAYIAHNYGDTGMKFVVGQFKLPFLREELIDSRYQQTVERSLVNSYFSAGRSQGIMLVWDVMDNVRVSGAISDGMNQDNSAWDRGPVDGSTEWSLTGRADVLLGGTWDQFHEFRSEPGEEMGILVGAALHAQRGEYGTMDDTHQVFAATVDGHVKLGGANIYAAGVYRNVDFDNGGNFVQWGALVQGGFHLTPDWEIFGRYEYADLDLPDLTVLGVPVYSFDDLHVVTVGVNHYMFGGAGHSAKWTTDVGYSWNRVEVGDSRTGWRSNFGGRDGQIVLRSQLQLAF